MRVGYGCQMLGSRHTGVGHFVASQARALVRNGAGEELLLYCSRRRSELVEDLGRDAAAAVAVVASGVLTRVRAIRILWEYVVMPRRAKRDRLDVFHAPAYVAPPRMPVPVVLTVHDILALLRPDLCAFANRHHFGLRLRASVRRACRVVVPSITVREQLLAECMVPPDRVEVVPPGVREEILAEPSPEAVAEVRVRHGLTTDFALFAGNLEPKKNLPRLIDAFALLRAQRQVRGELVLAGGSGWKFDRTLLEQSGVRYLGYVTDAELGALYRCARVLVFPSLAEGFGLPVIEGMACGLPVVCSDVPSLRESDAEAAVRVDPLSVSDIADGIERAWFDEGLRAELTERGRAAAERFSWDAAARRLWSIYRVIVNR